MLEPRRRHRSGRRRHRVCRTAQPRARRGMGSISPSRRARRRSCARGGSPHGSRRSPGPTTSTCCACGAAVFSLVCCRCCVGVAPGWGVCNPETPAFDAVAIDDRVTGALTQRFSDARRPGRPLLPPGRRPDRPWLQGRRAARPAGLVVQPAQPAPYVDVSGTWQAYEAERLSTRRKRDLRRLRRRLDEMGDLDFVVEGGGQRLDALVEEGFTTEGARGWKGQRVLPCWR